MSTADVERRPPLYAAMAFRSDARRLAVSAPNGELTLWDTTSGAPLRTGRLRPGRGIVAAAWNPSVTSLLAAVSADGTCSAWWLPDDRPPECVRRWPAFPDRPRYVGWVADGRCVFTVTAGGRTAVWDLRDASAVGRGEVSGGRPVVAAHCRGDQVVLVTDTGWARVWDPRGQPSEWIRLTAAPVSACAWSETMLLVAGAGGRVTCFDAGFQKIHEVRAVRGPRLLGCSERHDLVVAATGERVTAVGLDGTVRWEVPLGAASIGVAGDLVAVTSGHTASRPALLSLSPG